MQVNDALADQLIIIGNALLEQVQLVLDGRTNFKGLMGDAESFNERLHLLKAAVVTARFGAVT